MDPECAALPDKPVEQQGGLLRVAVVLDEELLEFVDDQQYAGKAQGPVRRAQSPPAGRVAVLIILTCARDLPRIDGIAGGRDVLNIQLAKQLSPFVQDSIQPLQHADAELAVRLDGNHPRMRQSAAGIGLELHPLLEIDEIEF